MDIQSLSTKPHRTSLGGLLSRLGKGKMDCVDMVREVDSLVTRSIRAPKKTPKTGNKKGKKKKGMEKAKKATKAKKLQLALSEGMIEYAESVQETRKEMNSVLYSTTDPASQTANTLPSLAEADELVLSNKETARVSQASLQVAMVVAWRPKKAVTIQHISR